MRLRRTWSWVRWIAERKVSLDLRRARKQSSSLMTWTCLRERCMEPSHQSNYFVSSLITNIGTTWRTRVKSCLSTRSFWLLWDLRAADETRSRRECCVISTSWQSIHSMMRPWLVFSRPWWRCSCEYVRRCILFAHLSMFAYIDVINYWIIGLRSIRRTVISVAWSPPPPRWEPVSYHTHVKYCTIVRSLHRVTDGNFTFGCQASNSV